MGRSEVPNIGLPILGSQYLVNYSFRVIQYYRLLEGKNGTPERINSAVEVIRNKEMGGYKASRAFVLPQTKLQRYIKDQQKSSSDSMI